MPRNEIDIYDLDGTIFQGNSFTWFTIWLFKYFLKRLSFVNAVRLLVLVVLRKLRRLSHAEVKRHIVTLAGQLPRASLEHFVQALAKECRDRLAELSRTCGSAPIRVLATAAPDIYAVPLAGSLGFDDVVASGQRGPVYVETLRERKRDEVVALAQRLGLRIGVLFTDHLDDISLAHEATRTVLVDALPETVSEMTARQICVVERRFRAGSPFSGNS